MKTLQKTLGALLTKVDSLLTTEPARMIGYGAAVVVYLIARLLTDKGVLNFPLTFDQSVTAAFTAITSLVIIVESIRRFVYSPMTYIEDLSDESAAQHEIAHLEEEFRRVFEAIKAKRAEQDATVAIPVGTVPTNGKVN